MEVQVKILRQGTTNTDVKVIIHEVWQEAFATTNEQNLHLYVIDPNRK